MVAHRSIRCTICKSSQTLEIPATQESIRSKCFRSYFQSSHSKCGWSIFGLILVIALLIIPTSDLILAQDSASNVQVVMLQTNQNAQQTPSGQSTITSQQTTTTLSDSSLIKDSSGQAQSSPGSGKQIIFNQADVIPTPEQRPSVSIELRQRAQSFSEIIRIISERANCHQDIAEFYQSQSKPYQLDANELRRQILENLDVLLRQHKSAVDLLVQEAERLESLHDYDKNLRFNYTDVHRLRNDIEWQAQIKIWERELQMPNSSLLASYGNGATTLNQALENVIAANNNFGISGSQGSGNDRSGNQQPISISGGAPVLGPIEWQTPIRSIVMKLSQNFGDIPVNKSMSAVHIPLQIYPGMPDVMNAIAWTESMDEVFKRNLNQYIHVHHQYYGDKSGVLRTFPAHKWRIGRQEPDLFDARTRPWYSAGVATPKDMVILIDSSGSMTGLRREIAKGVVFELLDTLNNNDRFAVLRFSENVVPIGIPRCQLRRPRFSYELHENCYKKTGDSDSIPEIPVMSNNNNNNNNKQKQQSSNGQQNSDSTNEDALLRMTQPMLDDPILKHECDIMKRQWAEQHNYQQEHERDLSNASYIRDDAYFRSIYNISSDIQDAFLLPANSRNIRYLKSNFSMPTNGIANFTHALMAAFELLNTYNRSHTGPYQCNKAIVLITDGAIRSHEEVFNRYNYPNSPVRILTYMIGREVGDIKPTKAMACNNRGYYANLINLSEVREQVLKYLPVFARPAVLQRYHPISWTSAYGDETYQVLTDWVLELKRRERARTMLNEERERVAAENNSSTQFTNIEPTNITEYDDLPLVDEQLRDRLICEDNPGEEAATIDQSFEEELDPLGYNELACFWTHSRRADLLTSVVKPVYRVNHSSLVFERQLLREGGWIENATSKFDAPLLGVAAVDLRIADMMKLAPSHLLGPNAYPILIGPNGFLLHHPDLRPLLEDPFDKYSKIFKPNFNAVELSHVEHVHGRNESERQHFQKRLIKLSDSVSKGLQGVEVLSLRRTVDCRRRAHLRHQSFFYGPVKDTPFSLLLAFPHDYGLVRASAKLDLNSKTSTYLEPQLIQQEQSSDTQQKADSISTYWTLHPDYRYCEGGPLRQFSNDSTKAIDFLLHRNNPKQANNLWSKIVLEDLTGLEKPEFKRSSDSIHCDKNLFPSLLFDAAATSDLRISENCQNSDSESNCQAWCTKSRTISSSSLESLYHSRLPRDTLGSILGLEMTYIATRSGLTRVRVFNKSARVKKMAEIFLRRHPRAVDEPWYSRTVDFNMRFMEDGLMVTIQFNANIRLIAKLRQRITQRQPMAGNSSRTNCDDELIVSSSSNDDNETSSSGNQEFIMTGLTGKPEALALESEESNISNASLDIGFNQTNLSDNNDTITANESSSSWQPINYSKMTTYELLELIANSSVHVSAQQTVLLHFESKKRSPVAVTGQLFDYSNFAISFLNKTTIFMKKIFDQPEDDSTNIYSMTMNEVNDKQKIYNKIELCPGGECPSRCGLRNDTIDCLLVDFNGFIIVAEELAHIGKSLAEYDDRLMASLVEQQVFQEIRTTDYQAICARNDQQTSDQQAARSAALAAAAAAANLQSNDATGIPSPLSIVNIAKTYTFHMATGLMANLASSLSIIGTTFYSMLTLQSADWSELSHIIHMRRSAVVDSDSSAAILATLPNKTFLRPCERVVTVYETPISQVRSSNFSNDKPTYYASKCRCSAWYVYEHVPKTNMIMLVVNTTSACRRNCNIPDIQAAAPIPGSPLPSDQQYSRETLFGQINRSAEEQVCTMLEQADGYQVRRYEESICYNSHPDESRIEICGSAYRLSGLCSSLILMNILVTLYIIKKNPIL